MKVAIIGLKGIPSRLGGVEVHVEEIASRLVSYGNCVTVYCRASYCSEKHKNYKGIDIRYIPSIATKHLDAITYTFLATINAIRNDYDVIQYHALGPSLLSFIPRLFGKKVVTTSHGLDWKRDKWGGFATRVLKIGELASIKFAHRTIAVSKSLTEYYVNKYNKEVTYIPNGIEKKSRRKANEIKEKFGLEKDEYILFLARLVPEKGLHYLIEAYNNIDTDKKLVIAGGSSHSDDYVSKVKEMAKDNSNIIFTDFVSGNLVDELFTNAYMYVLPSEIEGLPISLLEAMSYGQCCLVSNINENMEVIDSNAESFNNKDVESLKSKLEYLLKNRGVVNFYKESSEEFIRKKYCWDNVAKDTEVVFREVFQG